MQLVSGAGLVAASSRTARPSPVYRPVSCQAALAAAAACDRPVFVAGGTDLCAQFNEGLEPGALIALDRIPELQEICVEAGMLRIGGAVTHAAGAGHPLLLAQLPGFALAWRRVANVRIRSWATIGGNVMARRTRYEMPLLLAALNARLQFILPGGADLALPAGDFWTTQILPGALLRHVSIPLSTKPELIYDRTMRPILTLALCQNEAGGRATIATEYLPPFTMTLDEAGSPEEQAAAAFAQLPGDFADDASSHWYLRQAGRVLLRRALERAASHA